MDQYRYVLRTFLCLCYSHPRRTVPLPLVLFMVLFCKILYRQVGTLKYLVALEAGHRYHKFTENARHLTVTGMNTKVLYLYGTTRDVTGCRDIPEHCIITTVLYGRRPVPVPINPTTSTWRRVDLLERNDWKTYTGFDHANWYHEIFGT
jgi:hypothetical protein